MASYDTLYNEFFDAIEQHDRGRIQACMSEYRSDDSALTQDAADDLFGLACGEGDISTASFLLSIGADIDARDEESGTTALSDAATYNQLETVEWLIGKGADLDIPSYYDTTALHFVCTLPGPNGTSNNYAIAKALIDAGANVDAQDDTGETPLHRAARYGLVDIVKLLLDSGADTTLEDEDGLTAAQSLEQFADFAKNASPSELDEAGEAGRVFDADTAAEVIALIKGGSRRPAAQTREASSASVKDAGPVDSDLSSEAASHAGLADSSSDASSKGSSGGCYVATAVYGSYDCPQVWTLRRYRDFVLAESRPGRAFIKTYYAVSPTLVKWFGETSWFKHLCRGKLDRMVANLQAKGFSSSPYHDR